MTLYFCVSFSFNSMLCSGCSALHGVNSNLKKQQRLNSHYKAWSYKKKHTKRLRHTKNLFRKNLLLKGHQQISKKWCFEKYCWSNKACQFSALSTLLIRIFFWQQKCAIVIWCFCWICCQIGFSRRQFFFLICLYRLFSLLFVANRSISVLLCSLR